MALELTRPTLFMAVLLLSAAASAAPITVTYEITGGNGVGDFEFQEIQSGVIVVTLPNPGSGLPPISTTGHSIYYRFVTSLRSWQKTFTPARFPTGEAYRGPNQTLSALRRRPTTPPSGIPNFEAMRILANSTGQITQAYFLSLFTVEGTLNGWDDITGREVASTPEPGAGRLLAAAVVLVLVTSAAATRSRRHRWTRESAPRGLGP